ncbi:hypothetical protein AVEN_61834-1, partial [Araneus ventricosus]
PTFTTDLRWNRVSNTETFGREAETLPTSNYDSLISARQILLCETSIAKTSRLVGCSRSAIVSIHAKWINDGDTSSLRQSVGRPRVIKKKTSETVSLSKEKSAPDSGLVESPIQCRSRRKSLGTHNSADTVRYGTAQQTFNSCASVDQASSSTTPRVGPGTSRTMDPGPWMSGRELPGRMNPDFSFITWMIVSGYAV